ncbi:MAG: type II toxin-antitoxin system RelE/ParE family toxin [Pseudomonadota bacterium]|nr:type II toxin-antitoxin system RelE/ParE family toxin [Pseudomonadota bacterium]
MNAIEWKIKAIKQLRKINPVSQKRIKNRVQELQDFPDCTGVKALTNHQYDYRLRVGNYRVFFEYADKVKIVTIEEVKKRDERTY